MTETLLRDDATVRGADQVAAFRGLSDALLAEQETAGAAVAALVEAGPTAWAGARPWVALLATEGREVARRLTPADPTADAPLLAASDRVPPVVWAREVAAVQRFLVRAVRAAQCSRLDGDTLAVLRDAVQRSRVIATELRAAANP